MGGEYIQHWLSPPTYQAQKRHQYVGLKPPHTALPAQNHPAHRRKRLATSLLPLPRTAKNQTEDGPSTRRASVHVSIWEPWSTNMAPSSSQHIKPPRPTRNAAKQRNSSHAISPKRRRAPSNSTRADIWAIALPIHVAWSMATGQNHYRYGKA